MPRQKQPPRLWFRRSEGQWIIRDGPTYKRTGCSFGQVEEAERHLAGYIAAKWRPDETRTRQRDINLTDVIMLYVEAKQPSAKRPKELLSMAERLVTFWGRKTVSEIKGATCRAYAQASTTVSMARHDLEILRAAVRLYKREHGMDVVPEFLLPQKGTPRERHLTRAEAAHLLHAARRAGNHHLARFILIGLYTGSRSEVILALKWQPNTTGGWVDLDNGVLYRAPARDRATKKRKPPAVIPNRLMPHLRRWRRKDAGILHVVHWRGNPVARISKGFRTARQDAGLDREVTPHTLRHTCVTWLMQRGERIWDVAGLAGMTVQTLERVYGHHHPGQQERIRNAF